jgi:hypothetical protein
MLPAGMAGDLCAITGATKTTNMKTSKHFIWGAPWLRVSVIFM